MDGWPSYKNDLKTPGVPERGEQMLSKHWDKWNTVCVARAQIILGINDVQTIQSHSTEKKAVKIEKQINTHPVGCIA